MKGFTPPLQMIKTEQVISDGRIGNEIIHKQGVEMQTVWKKERREISAEGGEAGVVSADSG